MFDSRFIGGLLLIIGTSIGGGLLAMPVTTAEVGFSNSLLFLFLCWLVMTAGALLVLEVNLRLPAGSNMVSMAKENFGLPGQIIAWVCYLFLLYTLLSAYIAGGSDVFNTLLIKLGLPLSERFSALLFTLLFGLVVYNGIRAVDYVNRTLMFSKLSVLLILILIISPYVSPQLLQGGSMRAVTSSLMVLITSFGFASIVPSLREYFNDDIPALRRAILLGSLVPLVCYILWNLVIMGVVDRQGPEGLIALNQSAHATSGLTISLSNAVNNRWISAFFALFSSVCMLTAFLGVALGLFDFLADGLKLEKKGVQGKYTFLLTFIPPLALVMLNPGIYLSALKYAGVCCVIFLLFLPACMAWRGRQSQPDIVSPMIPGGKLSLLLLMATALLLVFIA